MAELIRDGNRITVAGGQSSTDATVVLPFKIDPITGRLLTDQGTGSGTVTSVSVVSANGLAGSVATATTTPAITLSTTITGLLKGNGTAISAASSGTDYVIPGSVTTSGLTMATAKILGRATAGTGAIEEIAVTGSGAVVLTTTPSIAGATFTGNVIFNADNTYDIGATGATRPKDLYMSGGLAVNSATATAGVVNVATGFRIGNAAAAGKILRGNGTNFINSTANYPDTASTSGNVLTSDGTNWLSSAPTVAIGTQVTGLGTGVAIALGVNVGSAGAFVTFNGALGTPSSGTVTNLTGTAGINITGTVNGLTVTSSTGTLTITNGKTLSATQSLTFSGTDSTTMTFPTTSASVARTDAAQTFTGTQTFAQVIITANAITASGNAATVPVTSRHNIVTNNSAATLTITLTTASAVNMQMVVVQILDFSAVAQTITWVNTENSTVSAPTTSNGSTTLPLTVGFIYNSATSKWRCIASA